MNNFMLQKVIMQNIMLQNIKDAKYYFIDKYCKHYSNLNNTTYIIMLYYKKCTNLKTLLCK